MRKLMSREERLRLIEDFKSSNLTVVQWCLGNGFKPDKFHRLLQTEKNYVKNSINRKKSKLSLIPVVLEDEALCFDNVLRIEAGKFRIEVSKNTDPKLLKNTLLVLESIC